MRKIRIACAFGILIFLALMSGIIVPMVVSSDEFPLWSILVICIFAVLGLIMASIHMVSFIYDEIKKELKNDTTQQLP